MAKEELASSAPFLQLSSVEGGTTQNPQDPGSQTRGRRQPDPRESLASASRAPAAQRCLAPHHKFGPYWTSKRVWDTDMAWLEALPYICGWLILGSCLRVGAQVRAGAPQPAYSSQRCKPRSRCTSLVYILFRREVPAWGVRPASWRSIRDCTARRGRTFRLVCHQFTIVFGNLKLLELMA